MVRASIYGSNASNAYGSGGNLNGPVGGAAVLSAGSAYTRIDEMVAQAAEARAAVLRAWRRVIIVSPLCGGLSCYWVRVNIDLPNSLGKSPPLIGCRFPSATETQHARGFGGLQAHRTKHVRRFLLAGRTR